MAKHVLRILGMTCNHCAITVGEALAELPNIEVEVSYHAGLARISGGELSVLIDRIKNAGYDAYPYPVRLIGQEPGPRLRIVTLGSGSAAFACAIRAAEKGAVVKIIEAETIGGTCVNVGCVPSKIFIRNARIAYLAANHPYDGLSRCRLSVDRKALQVQLQRRVDELRQAKYEDVLKTNPALQLIHGFGRLIGAHLIAVEQGEGTQFILADKVLVATGAKPAIPNIVGLEAVPYWTSTEALASRRIPQRLAIIGGSVVAIELAQAFSRLGSKVTLFARSTLLSRTDPKLGEGLADIFRQEGIVVRLHCVPQAISHESEGSRFHIQMAEGESMSADALLVATGREPNTLNIGLETLGIALDDRKHIRVDDHLRTNLDSVYAAGDCATLPQYVYVAAAAGTRAAINMIGGDASIDLRAMPEVIFTDPQVATVGLTEKEARQQGYIIQTRQLGLENVPRALANFDTRGFIKLIAEKESNRLLGAQIFAGEAGEIIQTAALALQQRLTVADLADMLFPYLTLVEGLKLCAQTFTRDVKQLSCCAG